MGSPRHPGDLVHHRGLYFRTPNGPSTWLCKIEDQWRDVSAPAALICNGGNWLLEKAVQGQGIIMMPRWVLNPYLQKGKLVTLDIQPPITTTQNPEFAIYLLYQQLRYHIPKVKVAVDFLVARIKNQSTWNTLKT